jgi:peroxiredoxin Q/BCP
MPKASPLPTPGHRAPSFRLPSSTGGTVSLSELTERGPAVLFFYPRADTPGCTKEACGFRDDARALRELGVSVVGISPDPLPAVRKFAEKFSLDYPLLADEDHAVAERYGVWQEKSMYGRKYMGVARTTVVVGKGGKVLHVFDRVKPDGHSAQVLDWLRANPG